MIHRKFRFAALGSALIACAVVSCDRRGDTSGTPSARASTDPTAVVAPSAGASAKKPEWEQLADNWKETDPIPNFLLTDQNGRNFRLQELSKSYVLIGFIFTGCAVPEACPLTTTKMRQVQELWAKRAKAGQTGGRTLHLLSCTIDPETDTPALLKRYGEQYQANFDNWTFATGPVGLMNDGLPSLFGVLALPSKKLKIAHTVKAALLGPGLVNIKAWDNNKFEPEDVVELALEHAK